MIYLLGVVLFLQLFFGWFLRLPIIGLDLILEFKFLIFLFGFFLVWIISGKSK